MTSTAAVQAPVRFLDRLPQDLGSLGVPPSPGVVLVYDEKLDDIPSFGRWKRSFHRSYPASAGESLKDVASFPAHIEKILGLVSGADPGEIAIVAAGGGSVGDFGGFVASVLKRGVRLVQLPTTWLAALDSAHGGKTALNVGGYKNQIGTFHPAQEVWIVRSMLHELPPEDTRAAYGELLKMAMVLGGDLFEAVATNTTVGPDELWALLPGAVEGKLTIVAADPREETGHRRVLNLGHTLGHALESHYQVAHGVAVGCGLQFTVEWSRRRGFLSASEAQALRSLLDPFPEFKPASLPGRGSLTRRRLEALLSHDKKSSPGGRLRFVFLASIGEPLVTDVGVAEIADEAERQGWL